MGANGLNEGIRVHVCVCSSQLPGYVRIVVCVYGATGFGWHQCGLQEPLRRSGQWERADLRKTVPGLFFFFLSVHRSPAAGTSVTHPNLTNLTLFGRCTAADAFVHHRRRYRSRRRRSRRRRLPVRCHIHISVRRRPVAPIFSRFGPAREAITNIFTEPPPRRRRVSTRERARPPTVLTLPHAPGTRLAM